MPKNKINVGGRPSKYFPSVLIKTKEYIDSCEDTEKRVVKYDGEYSTGYETKLKVNIPTLEGLALYLNVHKDTIQDWKGKYPKFSVLIGRLLSKQARVLVNKGLSGEYNPTIAKVLLTKHGYREGIDATTNDKPITLASPEAIALAKEYEEKLRKGL